MINKGRDRTCLRCLCKVIIVGMFVTLIVPLTPKIQKSKAVDSWWNTDYLKRSKITVTATRENLPAGTPVQISFDSHYLISAEVPSNQKMRSDGKDVRIIYKSGVTLTEIDRDIVSTSWSETDATVFFATQVEIAFSASSDDYWLYYDHDDESTSPLSSKTNIYGSHTKSYIPVSDRAISNRVADTITTGSNALNNTLVQKGINGYGDMAYNNGGSTKATMSSSTDLGETEGTVEFWSKDLLDADRESVMWSEAGCVDALARGCYANYRTNKIHWNVMMNDASTVKIDQTVADTGSPYANTWRQMAFTWKRVGDTGGEAKVYRDGIIIAEQSWANNYIRFPQDIGKMTIVGYLGVYSYVGGFDEFRSSDYAKEPADFVDYTYNAEIENNFYGDRAMMEVARSNYEVGGSGITTVQDFWFADIDDNYFYALAKDKVELTDRNNGAVGPFLTKQRKSDLAVLYYFDVGAYALAKGIPVGGLAFEADPSSSPPRLLVTIRDTNHCTDDGEITQFIDTGSAFEFEYAYEHDDAGVSPYNKLAWAQYLKYNSFDHNFYVSFWDGDRTCVGGLFEGAGTSKRPGIAKINPVTHSIEYLQLYEIIDITPTTRDDGLVHMDVDESGAYMYAARYNRLASSEGSFYKIDLSNFTKVGDWYGTQARGVGITKLEGEDAVLTDGRIAGRLLGKFSTIDGSLISGVNAPTGLGGMVGSGHLLMPVSKKAVLLTGGGNEGAAGLAWIADTNAWTYDPIPYEVGSRGDGHNDSLLMGIDGYMYLPAAQDILVTKFSPGISSNYSTVTPSATTVTANGATPLTFSINLKSLENKVTLPENLSVKVVPSTTEGLTLTDSSGYQMEQGFSGSTVVNGTATISLTSSKTQKVNFTVYAEGIELDQIEVDFITATCGDSQGYNFNNSADYTYNSNYISLAGATAKRVAADIIPGLGWTKRQKITIDKDMVSTNNQTDFPVMVRITDQSNPIFTGAQADGDDIVFTSINGTTKLSHDLERFETADGSRELIAWIKIPVLSSSEDTGIYMYYGNTVATSQQSKSGTWSGHTAVWHMDEASWVNGVADVIDAKGSYNGTSASSAATASGGIYREGFFNGVLSQVNTGMSSPDSFTVEAWAKLDVANGNYQAISVINPSISGGSPWQFGVLGTNLRGQVSRVTANGTIANAAIALGTRYHLALTYDSATDIATQWINGVSAGTVSVAGDAKTTTQHRIGNTDSQSGRTWNGNIDELKISSTAHDSSWLTTEYNNLNDPASFYFIEAESSPTPPDTGYLVIPNQSLSYYSLCGFSETTTDYTSDGDVKYQISDDNGTTWYWWNGSSWAATTGSYTEANTDDLINTNISTFSDGTTQKTFKWKMIYLTDYETYPEINSVTVSYSNTPPATPTPTPSPDVAATATAAPPSSLDSSSSSSSLNQSAIRYNVITNYKTSDYAFVIGANSISKDDPATREDTNFTTGNIYDIYDQLPIFRGTTYPNSNISIEITGSSGEKITGKTISDNDGYWQYQPAERLTAGEYTIVATVENKDKGINFTSDIYRFKIIDSFKPSTPALLTNKDVKEVSGLEAGLTFWAYLIFLIALCILIIFFAYKKKYHKQ